RETQPSEEENDAETKRKRKGREPVTTAETAASLKTATTLRQCCYDGDEMTLQEFTKKIENLKSSNNSSTNPKPRKLETLNHSQDKTEMENKPEDHGRLRQRLEDGDGIRTRRIEDFFELEDGDRGLGYGGAEC
ncbi:hypothetical protein PIB30_048345, partial [Stylosanthes scabra]|nr:hypothetical protein [Stylosanthes scabra]